MRVAASEARPDVVLAIGCARPVLQLPGDGARRLEHRQRVLEVAAVVEPAGDLVDGYDQRGVGELGVGSSGPRSASPAVKSCWARGAYFGSMGLGDCCADTD
jgi:hypothetical protein